MGIQGFWDIYNAHPAPLYSITDYALEHAFIVNHGRMLKIGVDAGVLLAGYRASQFSHPYLHATVDAGLSQLYRFLCQVSRAPVHCIFVYDGKERIARKRGIQVRTGIPLLHQRSQELVKSFGFDCHTARAEADSDLAYMNKLGIIDAVLTKDSDLFALGAHCILKVVPEACTETKLMVKVYNVSAMGLNQGATILFALLSGSDADEGFKGIGPIHAHALAHCEFANQLPSDWARISETPYLVATYFATLKRRLIRELKFNQYGELTSAKPKLAEKLEKTQWPSLDAVRAFLAPVSAWSDPSTYPEESTTWLPRIHDVGRIAEFCANFIGWVDDKKLLEKFHSTLFPGLVIRMLCSTHLEYNATTGELLAPSASLKANGLYFACRTRIRGKNPPRLSNKHNTIRIAFETYDFLQSTNLDATDIIPEVLNILVPLPIITLATQQNPALELRAQRSFIDVAVEEGDNGKDSRGNNFIDLTIDDDEDTMKEIIHIDD